MADVNQILRVYGKYLQKNVRLKALAEKAWSYEDAHKFADEAAGLLNAGYLAACLRDGQSYKRNQLYEVKAVWKPIFEPDISSLSGIGDAVQKIQSSFPDYFTEDKLGELTGI